VFELSSEFSLFIKNNKLRTTATRQAGIIKQGLDSRKKCIMDQAATAEGST
jgi:hypothetical protein